MGRGSINTAPLIYVLLVLLLLQLLPLPLLLLLLLLVPWDENTQLRTPVPPGYRHNSPVVRVGVILINHDENCPPSFAPCRVIRKFAVRQVVPVPFQQKHVARETDVNVDISCSASKAGCAINGRTAQGKYLNEYASHSSTAQCVYPTISQLGRLYLFRVTKAYEVITCHISYLFFLPYFMLVFFA